MRGHRLKAVGSIYWAGRCRNWTKTKNPAFKRVVIPSVGKRTAREAHRRDPAAKAQIRP